MKISLNWIKDYVDINDIEPTDLANKITNAGVNVATISKINLDNVVVGQILECHPHEDSDHLNVCLVDVGKEQLQIICGAPNVKKDMYVAVALPGAILKDEFEIKERTVRGVTSNGMICSEDELGIGSDKEGILDLGKGIIGTPITTHLGLDDIIFDLDLNPNRGDCLSHIGFAYETKAVLNKQITLPDLSFNETNENIKDNFNLSVVTDKCPLYRSRLVKNVKIGPSPDFIKKRLESAGMRSINNVVDISNYIMLEYGQPLHFFDYNKLGNKIEVRNAKTNEKVITLDDEERILNEEDIVITDTNKVVAIAGVMGAKNTDVDDNTTDILIESAIFDSISIRYTSLRLNLRSEASLRFEKGLNYEYTNHALLRACYLLEKYAAGEVLKDEIVHDKLEKVEKIIDLPYEKIKKVLGIEIPIDEVNNILNRLGFSYKLDNNMYTVLVPNRCLDINIKEDLIEEIGRLYGYDKLLFKLPVATIKKGSYMPFTKFRKDLSKRLRTLGLDEVKTYTLISNEESNLFNDKDNLKLLLPMSLDKSILRTSIISPLLKVYDYNKARGITDINIYEISNVYDKDYNEYTKLAILISDKYNLPNWQNNSSKTDFYTIKGILENILKYLGLSNRVTYIKSNLEELHNGISGDILIDNEKIGFLGKINPKINKDNIYVLELYLNNLYTKKSKSLKFREISKYPEIKKDVAFILDKSITSDEVLKEIRKNASKILKEVNIFDLYINENLNNKKSLAFELVFSDLEKTLTEEEVDLLFRDIINKVKIKFNCEIRDK